MSDSPPLARLFAMAYASLVDGLHEELRARGWRDVRPSFGFALLAARDGSTTSTALAELMGTTKQAASKLIEHMTAAGLLEPADGEAADGRRRPVRLTERGRDLLATVEDVYADLEAGWAEVVGRDAVERLRRDLLAVVLAGNDGELPPVRQLR